MNIFSALFEQNEKKLCYLEISEDDTAENNIAQNIVNLFENRYNNSTQMHFHFDVSRGASRKTMEIYPQMNSQTGSKIKVTYDVR